MAGGHDDNAFLTVFLSADSAARAERRPDDEGH